MAAMGHHYSLQNSNIIWKAIFRLNLHCYMFLLKDRLYLSINFPYLREKLWDLEVVTYKIVLIKINFFFAVTAL